MPQLRIRLAERIERHPRLWGLAFAVLLLAGYTEVIRPARMWVAERVAYPLFQAIDTPRARSFQVLRIARRADAVWALPVGLVDARPADQLIREEELSAAQWAAPVGIMFILPALFLIALFPSRPYWLWLLGYHVAIGLVSLVVFAIGLGWFAPAFKIYLFSRTYLTEAVSLAVPLLLALAARAEQETT